MAGGRTKAWRGMLGLLLAGSCTSAASDAPLRSLEEILSRPESKLDLAEAKLAIDRLIDPSIDTAAVRRQLDAWVAVIDARLPASATRRERLDIVLSSLYQPGPWNDHRPFRYDFENPFGRPVETKLLSHYLSARKGNCVSMPILVALLGQRLGLPVTLATAPQHVLVKYLDDSGQWLNVEATQGGFKYDTSYERDLEISARAIENQLYLRPLSARESVAVMLATLMEFYGDQGQQLQRIAVADLALKVDPNDVGAMVHAGAAYYLLLKERYMDRYPTPADIPPAKIPEYERLSRENLTWFTKAETLGWTPPSQTMHDAYVRAIQEQVSPRQEKK